MFISIDYFLKVIFSFFITNVFGGDFLGDLLGDLGDILTVCSLSLVCLGDGSAVGA
jgi:hypothetical protein